MAAFKACMKNLQQTSGRAIKFQLQTSRMKLQLQTRRQSDQISAPDKQTECNLQLHGLRRNWKWGEVEYLSNWICQIVIIFSHCVADVQYGIVKYSMQNALVRYGLQNGIVWYGIHGIVWYGTCRIVLYYTVYRMEWWCKKESLLHLVFAAWVFILACTLTSDL